jgi:hypothetical protein
MKNLRPKPLLFATGWRCIALGQCRSQGQAVMNGNDGQRDQTGGYDRMHDEYEPMARRCIRAFDCALDENAILVTLADNSGHGRHCCDWRSGRRLAQYLVELVLECQFFFLQHFDGDVHGRFDSRFHVPDPLIEFIVLIEEIEEMTVGGLELGD